MTWTREDSEALDAQIRRARRAALKEQRQAARGTPWRLGTKGHEPATDEDLKRRRRAARRMRKRARRPTPTQRPNGRWQVVSIVGGVKTKKTFDTYEQAERWTAARYEDARHEEDN